MRLRRIEAQAAPWPAIDLHAHLTVVVAQDAALLEHLESTLSSMYLIAGSDLHGVIEYSGFEMPLDQTSMVSLDLSGEGLSSIDMDAFNEARVRIGEAAISQLRSQRSGLAQQVAAVDGAVLEAERQALATRAGLEALESDLVNRSGHLDGLISEAQRRESRKVELSEFLTDAGQHLGFQAERVAGLEGVVPSLRSTFDPDGSVMRSLRIGDSTGELRASLEALDVEDSLGASLTERVLDWLADMESGSAARSSTVVARIDEIRDLAARWDEAMRTGVEGEPAVIAARESSELASERLSRLEELARSGLLAEHARAEIDEAHDSGDPARESAVLERYGFDSYLDYTIVVSTRSVGEALGATVETARAEAAKAQGMLDAERASAAELRRELSDRRDALRDEVQARTGVDPDELTEEVLSLIPEPPAELHQLNEVFDDCLDRARNDLAVTDAQITQASGELAALENPELIDSIDAERQQLAEMELLRARAEELNAASSSDYESARLAQAEMHAALEHLDSEIDAAADPSSSLSNADLTAIVDRLSAHMGSESRDRNPLVLSVPDGLHGWEPQQIIDVAGTLSETTQVILLSADDRVGKIARRLGPEVANVVQPGKRDWFSRHFALRSRSKTGSIHSG